MGYAYGKDGKTLAYKMGTNNAGLLLKGAKKVPKGTLFFLGQNGQLYMRSGPYLDGDAASCSGRNNGPIPFIALTSPRQTTEWPDKTPPPAPSRPAGCCSRPSGCR